MKLEDSAQQIAEVCLDTIAQADERVLDLEVLAVMFLVVIEDAEGKVKLVTGKWEDPD